MGDNSPPEAKWAYTQIGIGPVIASGLSAHIDLVKADTISAVWKFAGQAPGFDRRQKGTKIPYNARLKPFVGKSGNGFSRLTGKKALFMLTFPQFKAQEIQRNDGGLYQGATRRE